MATNSILGIYFLAIAIIWGLFNAIWLILIFRRLNLLLTSMKILVLFKFANALSLSFYFLLDNKNYWGVFSLCMYSLYNSLLLSILMLISEGYCIIYENLDDVSILVIGASTGLIYLIYSVSLINSNYFGPLLLACLTIISLFITNGCNKVISKLMEILNTYRNQRFEALIINDRIKRYNILKKTIIYYNMVNGLIIIISFVAELINYKFSLLAWCVIESVLELSRFLIVTITFTCFNPHIQKTRFFFRPLLIRIIRANIIESSIEHIQTDYVYNIALLPHNSGTLLSIPYSS